MRLTGLHGFLTCALFLTSLSACSGGKRIEVDAHLGGDRELTGTFKTPMPLAADTSVVVAMIDLNFLSNPEGRDVSEANAFSSDTLSASTDTIAFRMYNLNTGKYLVSAFADIAGDDGKIGEGDLAGFYGGSITTPALWGEDAKIVEITDASPSELQFGIGKVTCFAKYGEACEVDEDCRGTICPIGHGGNLVARTCDATTKQCTEFQCKDPSNLDMTVPSKGEASCFGDF